MNAPFRPEDLAENETATVDAPIDDAAQKARRRRFAMIVGGVLVVAAGGLYAITHRPSPADATAIDPRLAVTAVEAKTMSFSPEVLLSGVARPVNDIHVYAPASGVRVLEILADEGQTVRAGQPLARLDQAVSAAQSRAAQATVAEARASAVRARDEYERANSIRDSGALSAEQIESRRAAAEAADARLAAAQAQLAEVNARLQGGFIRAPAGGLIIDRTVEVGRPVDGQVLFRIAGDNRLEVAAEIAEADILALRVGQDATFRLADGSEVTGRMSRGAASIDERTRTGEVLFTLPRDTKVRAGMYLRGAAVLEAREGVAAPQDSILYANGEPFVYELDQNNRARRTPVLLGARQDGMVEIRQGLEVGARIAGPGAAFIQDGDEVRPVEPPTRERAASDSLRGRAA